MLCGIPRKTHKKTPLIPRTNSGCRGATFVYNRPDGSAGGCLACRITGADRLVLLGQRWLAVGRAAHEGISAVPWLRRTIPQFSDCWLGVLISFNAPLV